MYAAVTLPCTRVMYICRVYGQVHGLYMVVYTVVYTAMYMCTRSFMGRVHTRTQPFTGRVHGRYKAVYVSERSRVHGSCTAVYGPCTRVHGRPCMYTARVPRPYRPMYTARVHGHVHGPYTTVYTAVHGPCTLNNN